VLRAVLCCMLCAVLHCVLCHVLGVVLCAVRGAVCSVVWCAMCVLCCVVCMTLCAVLPLCAVRGKLWLCVVLCVCALLGCACAVCCAVCCPACCPLCVAVQPRAEVWLLQAATMASLASSDPSKGDGTTSRDLPQSPAPARYTAATGTAVRAPFSQVVLKFSGEAESKRFLAARSSGFVGVVVVSTYKTAQTFLG
jgi:hypothetical protein